VLLNLLSNAIKYNRKGGRVTVACVPTDTELCRLTVTDTGIGIAQEKLSLLFSPFERLGAEQSGIEGSGIGLALSKRLVEAMGGTIGVDSGTGRGSTFWVELPLGENPVETYSRASRKERAESPAASAASPAMTVLYIEDNPPNSLLMERILENRPAIQLISAMQGRLGLELARQHRPDLILLDLHLPDLHGKDVLQHLRASPETAHIPVAIISADATPGQVERLLAAGAETYFTKPLDVKVFLDFLDNLQSVEAR
jgi:CheY-like chemotaxis protein